MSFNDFGLSAEILRAVSEQGYATPTAVQIQSIPVIMKGRDVLAGAQTGTGKTAGFTLPMLHRLAQTRAKAGTRPSVRMLVLTPTRELAAQVHASATTYGKYLPLKSTAVFGGVNINRQVKALRQGVDILIATPGRLLDHAGQGTVDLSKVECLVLDEADRMLDMGFIHDIRRILALLPEKRQNLLFSATFSREIRTLAKKLLDRPVSIEPQQRNTAADSVRQLIHPVDRSRKRALLSQLISKNNWHQVLVFTRTKHGADRLARQLCKDGLSASAIHGNKTQGARTRVLKEFKQNKLQVLVATDIAARGLDIAQLPHVINFELPHVAEDYVHRIGRTGRAGHAGEAISLVSAEEEKQLADIERLVARNLVREVVPGYEPQMTTPVGNSNLRAADGRRSKRSSPNGKSRRKPSRSTGGGADSRDASGLKAGGRGKTISRKRRTRLAA